jgi:hypothetical protein
MRRNYRAVRTELRLEPNKQIIASLDRMTKLLENACENNASASVAVRGLCLWSKGNELRGIAGSSPSQSAFDGARGRVLEVAIRRDGVPSTSVGAVKVRVDEDSKMQGGTDTDPASSSSVCLLMASQLLGSFDVVDGALQAYEDINVLPE